MANNRLYLKHSSGESIMLAKHSGECWFIPAENYLQFADRLNDFFKDIMLDHFTTQDELALEFEMGPERIKNKDPDHISFQPFYMLMRTDEPGRPMRRVPHIKPQSSYSLIEAHFNEMVRSSSMDETIHLVEFNEIDTNVLESERGALEV